MEPIDNNNPTPAPVPEPTSNPMPEPLPEPTLEQPAPMPEPISTPTPEPAPEQPVPISEPTPTPESTPEPTSEPLLTPEPTLTTAQPISQNTNNKKPLVITAIVLLLVALVAGGFAFAAFFPFGGQQGGQSSGDSGGSGNSGGSGAGQEYDLSSMSDFDFTFLRLQDEGKNVIYSPLSIKYALAMLSDGADGESKTQITNLIGDYTPKSYTNSANRSLANAMFIRESVKDTILSSYTTTLQQKYNADVVYESFASVAPINQWISNKTLGIIQNMLTDDDLKNDTNDPAIFILINALAIDMNWNNQLQCSSTGDNQEKVPCIHYWAKFDHENYSHWISYVGDWFEKISFNGEEVEAAKIGASANRYNIIEELGEEYIRSTVLEAYEKWKVEKNNGEDDDDFNIDDYMEELKENYGKVYTSTDFFFSDNDDEKVFAKDLKTYDNTTLQYVGIMPKEENLNTYINNLTTERLANLINGIKDSSKSDNYKEGVVTQIEGYIPFFDFDYNLELKENLEELGVTDIFSVGSADLSKLTSIDTAYIQDALHKANIDFSNDGIRAAAVTVAIGGMGAGYSFDYQWDVPVETIDMTFDKPFFFIIRDKSTGEVWFTGAVYQPAE